MTILCLCREDNLCWEPRGYARAFRRRGIRVQCVDWGTPPNADIRSLIRLCPERPFLIWKPETDFPLLPRGLTEIEIPTVCIYNDPYVFTHRRARWAKLFDYVVLLHPGFERQFRDAGHPRPITSPHAVDAESFEGPEEPREIEVASVGRTDGRNYRSRRAILSRLASEFRANEYWRHHTYDEMASVYRATKIVVNVPRDDFPVDVSLRFAEAMAAGAVFMTPLPSELTALGFEENVNFVGYRGERHAVAVVRELLRDGARRERIAEAGRAKALREFTYDSRVANLLEILDQDGGRLFAPARNWSEDRIRLTYVDYFTASSHLNYPCLQCAHHELRQIARQSIRRALAGTPLLAGGWSRWGRVHIRGLIQSAVSRLVQ